VDRRESSPGILLAHSGQTPFSLCFSNSTGLCAPPFTNTSLAHFMKVRVSAFYNDPSLWERSVSGFSFRFSCVSI
jgi:hypothetical protein